MIPPAIPHFPQLGPLTERGRSSDSVLPGVIWLQLNRVIIENILCVGTVAKHWGRYRNLCLPWGRLWFCWKRRHVHVKWVTEKGYGGCREPKWYPRWLSQPLSLGTWRVWLCVLEHRTQKRFRRMTTANLQLDYFLPYCFSLCLGLFPRAASCQCTFPCVCVCVSFLFMLWWFHCLFVSFSFSSKIAVQILEEKQFRDNAAVLTSMNKIASVNQWYRIRNTITET